MVAEMSGTITVLSSIDHDVIRRLEGGFSGWNGEFVIGESCAANCKTFESSFVGKDQPATQAGPSASSPRSRPRRWSELIPPRPLEASWPPSSWRPGRRPRWWCSYPFPRTSARPDVAMEYVSTGAM